MASFVSELWESVFTPGTNPALIIATHVSFVLLISSLLALTIYSKSIHFFNLLVISVILYALVVWFINELKQIKLKDNDQLQREAEEGEKKEEKTEEFTGATTGASGVSRPTKRKV